MKKYQQLTWGIIGCGKVCEVKSGPAFYLLNGSSLKAVMRRNIEKAKDFAIRHHVPDYYDDANELLADKSINAVYIATPPSTHAEYAIKAMEAGKLVYVEKPMAMNHQECLKMIETSRKTGMPLFVAYYRRAFPYFQKIREIIENEVIGRSLILQLTTILAPRTEDYSQIKPPWHIIPEISGGGYFFDLACHQLDILDFLFGEINEVHGFNTNRGGIYGVEDTLTANLKFKGGLLGTCCWSYVGNKMNETDQIELFGTKGKLSFSISADSPIVLIREAGEEKLYFEKPKHVEMPLIEQIVGSLLGKNFYSGNMESAARTSLVMDKIMGRI